MPKQQGNRQGSKQGHKGNKGSKGNKQGNKKDKNKNKHKGSGGPEPNPIYDPSQILVGKDLRKFVKSQVRLQSRPMIQAAKSQLKTLQGTLEAQSDQTRRLGEQSGSNISSYYQNLANQVQQGLATQQAAGAKLGKDVQAAGSRAQGAVTEGAQQAVGALDASDQVRRAGPSSAREELAKMVLQQKSGLASENQTLQASAAGQAADWQGLLRGSGQAAQMQGAATLSDNQRQVASRLADLQNSYAPNITDAATALRTARETKGDLRKQVLYDTRDAERQYDLAVQGLGLQKDQTNAQLDVAKQYGKNAKAEAKASRKTQLLVQKRQALANKREQRRSLEAQLAVAQQQGDNKKAEQIRSRISQLKVGEQQLHNKIAGLKAAQKAGFGSNASGGKGSAGKLSEYSSQQKADARQRVKQVYNSDPTWLEDQANRQQLINRLLNSYHINPQLTKFYIKKFLKKHKTSGADAFTGQTVNATLNSG